MLIETDKKLLTWTAIDQIAEAPSRLIAPAMRLMSVLKLEDDMTMTITHIVTKTKLKDGVLHEIVEHMPTVFSYNRGTTRIRLNFDNDPWELSPAQQARMDKALEKNRAAEIRAQKQAEEDARDTPFNNMFRRLEEIGIAPSSSKNFLRSLLKSHTMERIGASIDAAKAMPNLHSPSGFILNWLKTNGTVGGGRAATVYFRAKPTGTGRTEFLGWENELRGDVRFKLYRRPDGTLAREKPSPDETVPSLAQDPGLRVIT